jgi:transcriptional regulator of acetoin/glycerol metabolism
VIATINQSAQSTATSSGLLGHSLEIKALLERLPILAAARRTTLITGPTGSGKEVVASELHRASGRGPLVNVHCGALPEQLAESELFGHARGAFTGAHSARPGLIRSASGGTLFLDEIDSLSLGVQAKLLRFLETGEYRAVGSDFERAEVGCSRPPTPICERIRQAHFARPSSDAPALPALRSRRRHHAAGASLSCAKWHCAPRLHRGRNGSCTAILPATFAS